MKSIPVKEAVGSILCHDITQILPGNLKAGSLKRAYYNRGGCSCTHVFGGRTIYVWEEDPNMMHENDAIF